MDVNKNLTLLPGQCTNTVCLQVCISLTYWNVSI